MIESVQRLPALEAVRVELQMAARMMREYGRPADSVLYEAMDAYLVALDLRIDGIEMGMAVLRESKL